MYSLLHTFNNKLAKYIVMVSPQGADIVVSDMEGKTALHWTVNNDNASAAMAILVCIISCHGDVIL